MTSRQKLERHQVWCYLFAVVLGLFIGSARSDLGQLAETLVWPVLALLLYATLTQMPLASIPAAFADGRFIATALAGNFVVLPLVVWGIVQLLPDEGPLRLGLLLVLLVPCTDWFITFSHLGRGDAARATAFTPVALVLQLVLLPLYLWLFAGIDLSAVFALHDVWPAFLVVLSPLVLAAVTAVRATTRDRDRAVVEHLGWWPVPLLAMVILLVATAHVGAARDAVHLVPVVGGAAALHLAASLVLAKLLAVSTRLPTEQGRTLAFSFGTRNSFIVLPFALSLPTGWEAAAVVIVMQSLVELFGMVFYLWYVPGVLFTSRADRPPGHPGGRIR